MKRKISAHWINESQATESKPPEGLALFLLTDSRWGVGQCLDAVLVLLLYTSIIILDSLLHCCGSHNFSSFSSAIDLSYPKTWTKTSQIYLFSPYLSYNQMT